MKLNECTHLIVSEPKGQKFDYACKWNVHIVNLKWLYDSLDVGYCLNEKDYQVKKGSGSSGVKTSTPEKTRMSGNILLEN